MYERKGKQYIQVNDQEYYVLGEMGYEEDTAFDTYIFVNLFACDNEELKLYTVDFFSDIDGNETMDKCAGTMQNLNERTVYDNIALPLQYMRIGRREIGRRIDEMLERMEIADKKYAYPYELSGGQCQRVALARALVTKPKLLLADEPTGALDDETGKKIMGLLQEINKLGTTIIMVTHDSDFAKLGSRCITMKDGMVL